ncbi:fatty acid hydroxylase domain-containing protein 2-like [Corticium candelabrum]|uniref:fatty acid hydroxylase domain-containing protein 2-like n=1 Tax=Corticium candelabrum TaxID=121492 RepID=UPI002E272F26|nr:fatty acid hydroxylase domain-containing protein 2-like [Corticium candelabrum]
MKQQVEEEETTASQATLGGVVKKAAFMIIPILVVTIAARNSVVWHIEHFFGASRLLLTSIWLHLYALFDGDEKALTVWGTWISITLVFWLGASFFLALDLTTPAFIRPFKIQEDKNFPVDRKRLMKTLMVVVCNELLFIPFLWAMYYVMKWRGCTFKDELPTFQWFLIEFVVYLLIEEVGFYYSHRLLHHPLLYKSIHKVHHQWQAPLCIVGLYCHPVENLVSNAMPIMAGPLIMGSHLSTFWFWMAMAALNTLVSHCGYHLPFLFSNESHDYHHAKFNQNFGVLGILDYLHGTDAAFRESISYDRHFVLCGTTSAKELVPDREKQKSKCEIYDVCE